MMRMHTFGLALLMAVSVSALAQDKAAPAAKPPAAPAAAAAKPSAAAPAPQAAAAPAKPTMAADKSQAPKKKRVAKRTSKVACTKLDDPWDNVCQISKNAAVACKDLPVGKPAARKSKKGKAPAPATENRRQQCIDSYMRNV